jgi:hypothetical protein
MGRRSARSSEAAWFGLALALGSACSRETPSPAATAPTSTPTVVSGSISPVMTLEPLGRTRIPNDGTNARSRVLSPDDANLTDSRKGWEWSDRCYKELRAGKLGWAGAACDRGLALSELDPKAQRALLYNEGLVAEQAGDKESARGWLRTSLGVQSAGITGRAEVIAALARVSEASIETVASRTFPCGRVRCRADQMCCDGDYCDADDDHSEHGPGPCPLSGSRCDFRTGEPCVAPERCKLVTWSPSINTPECTK